MNLTAEVIVGNNRETLKQLPDQVGADSRDLTSVLGAKGLRRR